MIQKKNDALQMAPRRPARLCRPWLCRARSLAGSWRCSFLALVLILQAAGSFGQEPDEAFAESVRVHVVNVDVVVTDKRGEPVRGLVREDFELREGGDVVRISNFRGPESQASPEASETAREAVPENLSGSGGTREPLPAGAEQEERLQTLVLFIDNLHLQPATRNRALRRLRGSLSEVVQSGDRVMIVSFERSLHVRQPLTSDLQQVRIALIEAERMSTLGGQRNTERERLLARIESAKTLPEAEIWVGGFAEAERFDVQASFGGLQQLLDLLAGLPGRKAVLHVSDGLPMTAGAGLYHLLDLRLRGGGTGGFLSQRYFLRNEMLELTAAANAAGVTFHTLEAAGAGAPVSTSAARAGIADVGTYLDAELVRLSSSQETLMDLADVTGGTATIGTNNVDLAFDRIASDRQATYSLGFQSVHQGDGRYYPLRVEVKKKGLRVRHRKGYRNKSLETQLEESALAALRYGTGTNSLGLQLQVGAPRRQQDGGYLVPFELRIPFEQIVLVPREDFFVGQVRLVQVVLDQDGERSHPEHNVLPLRIPATEIKTALAQSLIYEAELLMERGDQRLVVGVLDELSTRTAMIRKIVSVGGR